MSPVGLLEGVLLAVVLLICLALTVRWVVKELGYGKRKSGGGCENCSESPAGSEKNRLHG